MRKLNLAMAAMALAVTFLTASVARADLDAVAQAMGADKAASVQYSGTGFMFGFGQAYRPGLPWPKLNIVRFTRTDDYAKAAQSFDYTITRADTLGGTATPQRGEMHRGAGLVGDTAWAINYPDTAPVRTAAVPMQHDLWISPHGIVKAAMAAKATLNGSTFQIEQPGKFKARATVNAQNEVVKVESWIDSPVLGDTPVITTYSDYKDYGGIKFPGRINQSMGGSPVLEMTVTDVKAGGAAIEAPAQIGTVSQDIKTEKVADGVWFVSGGTHNSVVIEMKDYFAIVDTPLGDGRANGVIKAAKELVPNKPFRYLIITHHHFDHFGGARAAAAEGATIVLPDFDKAYFETWYANPHSLNPDALAKSGKKAKFETYRGTRTITDGARKIEIYTIENNIHADGFMMIYLPKEKILMEADAFSPRAPAPITQTPAFINPSTRNLWDNIQRRKLAVETILPMHGRIGKVAELKAEAGAN
jgi:glyoxylase-like metal-dependent hydrolase (beta-lactamase superfamily II)